VETAAVMKHLDLLIACNSGPAHVAGACGTKVFLLLPVASDVRWGLDRKTVWYPGHTLWHDPGRDWQIPVWEIHDAVERLVYHRSICRRP
jgi:ADP-heptose:LPS heptosyltransferase